MRKKGRVLVTGARGFLGSACVRALTDQGWEVIGTCSPGHSPKSAQSDDGVEWHQVDLLDSGQSRALLRRVKPSYLLHAAWLAVRGNIWHSADNLSWLTASIDLVRAFHETGGQRVAAIGSSGEYDWSEGICRNGVTPLRPDTLYGSCKHALQVALSGYADSADLGFVWPRVFFTYGPGEYETRLVASVIRSLVRGEPAETTNGEQSRDYLHIDDVARGIVAALDSRWQGPIDIVGGEAIKVRQLVSEVARQMGREDLLRIGAIPSAATVAPLVQGDIAQARDALGWSPRFSVAEGIADTIAWGRNAFAQESSIGDRP